MHSRIFGTARKKGVSYNIFSDTAASFYESSWDFGGQVNQESAKELFEIIYDQMRQVLDGKVTQTEIDAAKSYALGRHQMGAQTVSQISNFYTARYFGDGVVKDYEKVPDSITNTSRECMIETAREFINADTWVLAAVGSGEKEEINELSRTLAQLYT